jgi:hypothetical protein
MQIRPGKKQSQGDSPKMLFYVLLCILAIFSEFWILFIIFTGSLILGAKALAAQSLTK